MGCKQEVPKLCGVTKRFLRLVNVVLSWSHVFFLLGGFDMQFMTAFSIQSQFIPNSFPIQYQFNDMNCSNKLRFAIWIARSFKIVTRARRNFHFRVSRAKKVTGAHYA
jgi:hypothetical protein